MKRIFLLLVCLVLTGSALNALAQARREDKKTSTGSVATAEGAASGTTPATATSVTAGYVPVTKYDPARSAEQDLKEAIAEAQRTNRRILLEVGGEWCVWCHLMDEYFDKHPELLALREKNFVMVKINFSEENENKEFLANYPKVAGYPHLFVLDKDGTLLHSQDTGELEQGRGYNLEVFTAFLQKWSPAA